MNHKVKKSSRELYEASQLKNHEFSKHLLQIRYAALRQTSNDADILTQVDDKSRCDTCLANISTMDNQLVFCDLCNACVHQECYMRELKD